MAKGIIWVRWGPALPIRRDNFWRKELPIVMYRDFLPWAVHKWINRSICHFGCGLAWAEGSTSSVVFARWRQCIRRHSTACCAKTAEPIDLTFGLWTRVGQRKHKFNHIRRWRQCAHMGGHIGATWRTRLNLPSAAAIRSYVKLFWPLVKYPTT